MKRFPVFTQMILILFFALSLPNPGYSQNEDELANEEASSGSARISLGADFVSRYIWRGKDYGNSPSIQPNFAFSIAGFKIGAWGDYGISEYKTKINDTTMVDMGHYAEMDLFISYTFKWFTLGVTDYFFPNPLNPNYENKYFNYNNKTTGHAFEASLSFNGTEKVPLQIYVGTFFYGADKDKDSTEVYGAGDKNNFSTYLEASYLFTVKKIDVGLKPFIAGIPFGSAIYGDNAGIVNLGFTASKTIKITKGFSLPLYTSLLTNPQNQSIFFVFGFTLSP
jgi:hypothetical protein